MLILHLALIWLLVAIHIVGGTILFNRVFKTESPWFGVVLPALVIAMLCDFIEHGIGIASYRFLLPVTFVGSLWMIISPKTNWRKVWLPIAVFLVAFIFTTAIRGLKPNVEDVRDGRLDTHLIADYCMGETLPPTSSWEPPFKQYYYYSFEHFAASVAARLFGFDAGTAFNMAGALSTAFLFTLIGAIAWRLGGGKVWIVVVCVALTASAMSGSTAYLWLMHPDTKEPDDTTNILNRADCDHPSPHYPFGYVTQPFGGMYDQRELLVPGYWGWVGSFHSVVAGQLLTLLAVYCLVEMVRREERSIIPWIFGLVACLLILVCSTWGLPFIGLLYLFGLAYCLIAGVYPANWRGVVIGCGAAMLCFTPMLMYYLTNEPPGIGGISPTMKTQLGEWVVQWWPIYLPYLALLFYWRKLSPATLIVMGVAPLGLVAVEHWNIADHLDMTGKIWGYLFGAMWAVLIPSLAAMRSWATRGLLASFVIIGGISMCFWVDFVHRSMPDSSLRWEVDGLGDFHTNTEKGRILNQLTQLSHQVVVTGKCQWAYNESAGLSSFTHTYSFVADDFDCDLHFNVTEFSEGQRRAKAINAIYDGKGTNSLAYFREHNISAMVIYPDDTISNDTINKLKNELAGYYFYQDCRDTNDDGVPQGDHNAGVFMPIVRAMNDAPMIAPGSVIATAKN